MNGKLHPRDYTAIAAKHAFRSARRRGKPITWKVARDRASHFNMCCGRPDTATTNHLGTKGAGARR